MRNGAGMVISFHGRWGALSGRAGGVAAQPGGIVVHAHGADSEVGRLRTVLVHRPGLELRRITPRDAAGCCYHTLPWASRAQQEHDALASTLRSRGVEVLYVTELLQDALEYQPARDEAIASVLASAALGDELRAQFREYLDQLAPEILAQVLIAGLTPEELTIGRGVVFELLDRHDFIIDPLPNLLQPTPASGSATGPRSHACPPKDGIASPSSSA